MEKARRAGKGFHGQPRKQTGEKALTGEGIGEDIGKIPGTF